MENPQIELNKTVQLTFDKGTKAIQWGVGEIAFSTNGAIQMSFNGRMIDQTMVDPYHGMLNNKK